MKICTLGFRGITDQVSRLDQAFVELGHELTAEDPDLIFQNNGLYQEALVLASFCPKAKLIFNILDLATHVSNYPYDLLKEQLLQCHAITSISKNTQSELWRLLNLESEIIYNPLKITYRKPEIKKDIFCIFTGRANDSNKRYLLIVEVLLKLGKTEKDIVVCGSEKPYWGTYLGLVNDFELNELYNRSKYLISPTFVSGIELPIIEGQFAGVLPIVCNDNPTPREFIDDMFFADPNADSLATKIIELDKNRIEISQELIKNAPLRYKNLYYKEVARKILAIYEKIK